MNIKNSIYLKVFEYINLYNYKYFNIYEENIYTLIYFYNNY